MDPDAYREHIKKLVDEAPPLDTEQLARLAQLLRPYTLEGRRRGEIPQEPAP